MMSAGAWDYASNMRGYAPSAVVEWITPGYELRGALSLVPEEANGNKINYQVWKSNSVSLEAVKNLEFGERSGAVRLLGYFNTIGMGNYDASVALSPSDPDITATRQNGRTKYGAGLNIEQELTSDLGVFARGSINDGQNETWEFTEIDQSVCVGVSLKGNPWHRPLDTFGVANVNSGLSHAHRRYLQHGGEGFMLGDGNLNYAPEHLWETYYSAGLTSAVSVSLAYQYLTNPGYNKDQHGPVNVFSVRVHAEI
ncbi:MAG: carbohydrate porin [Bacteroidota bacterium]